MRFLLCLLVLLCIPFVSASLVVTPSSSDVQTFRGQVSLYSLSVFNNNSFAVFNVSFTNPAPSYFTFPSIDRLSPGDSRVVQYSVVTDSLFVNTYISVASFFYLSSVNVSSRVVVVNISNGSFSSSPVVMVNDSVSWCNLLNESVSVKDLNSGFVNVDVLPLSCVDVVYSSNASFSFYAFPGGFTGSLSVLPYSGSVLAHDSSFDVPLSFRVSSVVNPSSLQFVNVLPNNFSSNNNQSQMGVVEVKNFDNFPLYNVVLSDSAGWVSWGVNNFTLSGLENRLVYFNITPVVFRTNDTNVSLPVRLFAVSGNGGNGSIVVSLRVAYQNLDVLRINGTNYSINFLSVNDTIDFCVQFPTLDRCPDLAQMCLDAGICKNNTIVKEIPAQQTISEDRLRRWMDAMDAVPDQRQRDSNAYNRMYDDLRSLMNKTDLNTLAEFRRDQLVNLTAEEYLDDVRSRDVRFWSSVYVLCFLLLIVFVGRVLEIFEEFRLRVATYQE